MSERRPNTLHHLSLSRAGGEGDGGEVVVVPGGGMVVVDAVLVVVLAVVAGVVVVVEVVVKVEAVVLGVVSVGVWVVCKVLRNSQPRMRLTHRERCVLQGS